MTITFPAESTRVALRTVLAVLMGVAIWMLPATDVRAQESDAESAEEEAEPEKNPRVEFRETRPIEQWRYRSRIQIAFQPDPRFPAHRQSAIKSRFLRVIDRSWGLLLEGDIDPMDVADIDRRVEVEVNPSRLVPSSRLALERLDADALHEAYAEEVVDKVFMVTVQPRDGRTTVAARVFDTRLRSLSEIHESTVVDERLIPEQMFEVMAKAFRPVLVVHSLNGLDVRLRVQGGEFPAPDSEWQQVKKNDILLAVLRYKDRKKVVQQIQQLPSTYVAVEETDRGWVSGTLASALPVSLATSGRRRVDQFCVKVSPAYADSKVRFVLRRNPDTRLIGNRVRIYGKTRARDKTEQPPLELMTDREGSVRVPILPEHPVVWMYLESGEQLVQRVPFAPGIYGDITLELLDDSVRLAAEGELDLIEGQLIDTIARRAVFMAMAFKAAQDENQKEIDKALAEMEKLPALREFREKLSQVRVSATDEARQLRDRVAESRVKRICDKLESVLVRYLSEEKMREFRTQLQEKQEEAKANREAES